MKRWPIKPLGELCDVEGGNSAPQGDEHFRNGTIPFVRMKDLGRSHFTNNLIETDDKLTETSASANRMKFFKPGCILFPRSGSVALNHRAILGVRSCIVSHIGVLQNIRSEITTGFLYRVLTDFDMTRLSNKTTGVDSISFTDVKRIPIPVPPLAEQERIVKLLDEADELRKLRAQADRRTTEFIPALFHKMFGDPSTNPKHWPQKRFAEVGKLSRGLSKHRPRDEPSLYGGKFPFIQTGDVTNSSGEILTYTQTYSEMGLAQSRIWPAGTLCITIAANIGKTAILTFPACFPDSMVGFVPNKNVLIDFVRAWLVTMETYLEQAAPSSAQKNINLKILSELKIPVPPLPLQKEFSERLTEIRELESGQAASRRRLEELFQSLLNRAFNGEL
jgi:type I restriction enzyme S subunit